LLLIVIPEGRSNKQKAHISVTIISKL